MLINLLSEMGVEKKAPTLIEVDQMKKDLGGSIDIPMSPLKRPSEKDPNKKPASLSRSYCEICKKELCNKYFMKTHMMKMHGELEPPTKPI